MSLTDFGIAICQTKWTWMELFDLYKESYRAICTWKLQRSCWTLDDVSVIYAYLSIISNMDNLSVERVWLISNRRSSLFVLEFLSPYSNVHLVRISLSGKLWVVMQTIPWLCGSKSLGNYAILRNWVVWINAIEFLQSFVYLQGFAVQNLVLNGRVFSPRRLLGKSSLLGG